MHRFTPASSSALLTFMALVVALGLLQSESSPLAAGQPAKRESVLASELGSKVDVIGRLGVPLGRLVTIEGRVASGDILREKAMSDVPILFVETIDGHSVASHPWIALREPGDESAKGAKPGTRSKLYGYENGGFEGFPAKLLVSSDRTAVPAGFSWEFRTWFEIAKTVESKPDESKQPYLKVPDGH
jgi:hypothetical protein